MPAYAERVSKIEKSRQALEDELLAAQESGDALKLEIEELEGRFHKSLVTSQA